MNNIIIEAIENRKLLEFCYKDHYRLVEPHTFGVSSKGNENLSVFQIDGTSERNNVPDWGLFTIDKIVDLKVLNETFEGTRPKYTKGDSRMIEIYKEL
jgi:predicted DNA-binding transcriptional regulator YafY